jgi:hypothetical protein
MRAIFEKKTLRLCVKNRMKIVSISSQLLKLENFENFAKNNSSTQYTISHVFTFLEVILCNIIYFWPKIIEKFKKFNSLKQKVDALENRLYCRFAIGRNRVYR